MFRYVVVMFLAVFLFAGVNAEGQTPIITNLKKQVANARNDPQKLAAIFALCQERLSISTDTLYAYALQAKQLASKHKSEQDVLKADYFLTFSSLKNGQFDSIITAADEHIQW